MPQGPTPQVNLQAINQLAELILRSGDLSLPSAKDTLMNAYEPDEEYPDVVGISTLFRDGATLDDLAREGAFPHRKISYSVVAKVVAELHVEGYELVLWITPTDDLPDHHTLAIRQNGTVAQELPESAAQALTRAFLSVDNPYRRQRS